MIRVIQAFFAFLKKPDRLAYSDDTFQNQLSDILRIFVFIFCIVMFVAAPMLYLVGADELPNKLEELNNLGIDNPILRNLALFGIAVVFAPLIEEFIFRYPLKFKRGSLFLLSVGIGACLIWLLTILLQNDTHAIYYGVGAFIIVAALLAWQSRDPEKLTLTSQRYFPSAFYVTALMFAAAHISNYELKFDQWMIAPVLVLPQFLLGLALGYVRIKYGLWLSLIHI